MVGRDEAARILADAHYRLEPAITRIFTLREKDEDAPRDVPVKLLQINPETPPSGIMPLYFGPSPEIGIPYPSVIVEITPTEFDQLSDHKLPLPNGWTLGVELPKGSG